MVALAQRVTACFTLALALWLSTLLSVLSAQAQDVITVGHCFRDSKCKDKFPAAIQSKPDGYEPIWATCISFMSDHNHGNLCKYLNCSSCVPLVTNFCYSGGPGTRIVQATSTPCSSNGKLDRGCCRRVRVRAH